MKHMKKYLFFIATALITLSISSCSKSANQSDSESRLVIKKTEQHNEVNVYSYRKEALIKPLLDQFSKTSGIKVNLVTGKADALLQRLQSEAENSPADILITSDAGRLYRAKKSGLLQSIESSVLNANVPDFLRDNDAQWFGLSQRARIIFYNKDKVTAAELSSYEDLADPKWKGRICIRSSDNIYNQSLLASIISHSGTDAALTWAKRIVANFARPPKGNDRSQLKGAALGVCDLAIANSYYFGAWLSSADNKTLALSKKLGVFFPNQKDRGAHMNISGAGVTKHSKNKDQAIQLLEFLSSVEAQNFYAQINHEYPVNKNAKISDLVKSWGYPFKGDTISVDKLGSNNPSAIKVFDQAGWK